MIIRQTIINLNKRTGAVDEWLNIVEVQDINKYLDEKRNDFFSRKISYFTHHYETTGWHTLGYTHSAPDREQTFKEEWLDK